ncbi:uncharacterized protein LOC131210785 [Anopheles bellator]|uniref:uncharacterized protein LOC131210785 n=1 Tax=Anopheles bellator TaxID=139047 RepID=UPI002649F7DF|nr:uncharacterized protein LOC131210785 [Anopheles bellator]
MELPDPLADDVDEASIARAILSGNPPTCRMCLGAHPNMFQIDEEERYGSLTTKRIAKISKVVLTPVAGIPSFLCMVCKSFLLEWDAANREVARNNDLWMACHIKREWEGAGADGVKNYPKTKRSSQIRYEYECEQCRKPFVSLYAATIHVLEHKKVGPRFRCQICDERCLTIEEFDEHVANHGDGLNVSKLPDLSLKPEPED